MPGKEAVRCLQAYSLIVLKTSAPPKWNRIRMTMISVFNRIFLFLYFEIPSKSIHHTTTDSALFHTLMLKLYANV